MLNRAKPRNSEAVAAVARQEFEELRAWRENREPGAGSWEELGAGQGVSTESRNLFWII